MLRKKPTPKPTPALDRATEEREQVRRDNAAMLAELTETNARADAVLARLHRKTRPLRLVKSR